MLLPRFPYESTDDARYDLLPQMAVAVDDRECVQLLPNRGTNVNATGHYYGTPLQCAARFGNLELVDMLFRSGANANVLKGSHGTALRAAVLGGHEKVVDTLLEYGAEVDLRFRREENHLIDSESILHIASKANHYSLVGKLVAAGADVNAKVHYGPSLPILTLACESGNVSVVTLLLNNNVLVNAHGEKGSYVYISDNRASALHMACMKGHETIAQILIDHGADIALEVEDKDETMRNTSKTPLQVATSYGHLSIVRLLIQSGALVNHYNCHGTALSIASSKNSVEIAEALLHSGATITDSSGQSNALTEACRARSHEVIELLLDELSGTALEQVACNDALSSAALSEDDETFQLLLARGATTSSATLSQACSASLYGSVVTLLDSGIDVNSDNGGNSHALHVAAFEQRHSIVELLLARGADVNAVTEKHGSPLQAALVGIVQRGSKFWGMSTRIEDERPLQTEGSIEGVVFPYPYHDTIPSDRLDNCEQIVQLLLDKGVNVNTEPRIFGAPLHLASFIGSYTTVRNLLDRGAAINSTDRFGTALIATLDGNHKRIAELLLCRGVDVNYVSGMRGSALHYTCFKKEKAMVKMLLQHGAHVNAAGSPQGSPFASAVAREEFPSRKNEHEIVDILLRHNDFQVQEVDLIAAASVQGHGGAEDFLRLLLGHPSTINAMEHVLVATLKDPYISDTNILELLLQRSGDLGVTEAMMRAPENPEMMRILLNHRPICRVTLETIKAVGHNPNRFACLDEGRELIQMLLNRERDMPITEGVMIAVLSSSPAYMSPSGPSSLAPHLVEQLFERNPELEVTEAMLIAAQRVDDMKVLLQRAPSIRVTRAVLEAAAKNFRKRAELVPLLLDHDKTIQVPQTLLDNHDAIFGNSAHYFATLLERSPDLEVTTDLLTKIAVAGNWAEPWTNERKVVELFLKQEKEVQFTEHLCELIDRKFAEDPELQGLFYKLERKTMALQVRRYRTPLGVIQSSRFSVSFVFCYFIVGTITNSKTKQL